jgi:hypothetical protein
MASERKIRRYSAYFQGWATAFGNHDKHFDEKRDLLWLLGQDQIGLILTPTVKGFLHPMFLGKGGKPLPKVELAPGVFQVADSEIRFGKEVQREIDAIVGLLKGAGDLHLLQMYHLVYPSGTRILTLSRQAPLPLIYREIESLRLSLT